MNWLDVILLILLAWSIAASFRKGLTREVIGLVAVTLGLLLASWFYGMAGAFLIPYVSSRHLANLAGFFIVFLAVVILGAILSKVLGKFVRVTGLSFFDHALGAGFGLIRGVLVSVALIMGIMAFSGAEQPPEAVVHSRMAPYVIDAAKVFVAIAPHDLRDGFHKSYAQVKDAWRSAVRRGIEQRQEKDKNEKRI